MTAHKNYLFVVVLFVVVLMTMAVTALSAIVNIVVDPYGVYRLFSIDGFNALKPAAQSNLRLAKAYDLKRVKPDAIFLGNSRVDQGFDPHLPSVMFDRVVYNTGLPGSTIYELYRYLQHATATGPLDRVMLALDVFSFNTNIVAFAPSFSEGRLAVAENGEPTPIWNIERFRDLHHVYVAWPTLMKSLTTVADQDAAWASTRTVLGFNPMIEGDYFIRKTGYRESFARKDRNYLTRLLDRSMNLAPSKHWPSGPMVYFAKTVEFCRLHDIQLDLVIHPYHAHVLEIMHETGIWPNFDAWKRELVAVLASDRARYPEKAEFALWDFSTYNTMTMERIPGEGKKQDMTWYWESSHYKEIVGAAMAVRMYDLPLKSVLPADFGIKLTPSNLEAHLKSYPTQRQAYRQSHAKEIEKLEQMYRE